MSADTRLAIGAGIAAAVLAVVFYGLALGVEGDAESEGVRAVEMQR